MAYIQIIERDQAQGDLKEIYEGLIKSRGKLAEVHKIQSLNPKSISHHMDLYLHLMFGKSPLKRYQRELLGVITSKYNNCDYCIKHHAEALNHFWKDDNKIESLLADHSAAGLTPEDLSLCNYAQILTSKPEAINEDYIHGDLKQNGWEDRAILDATMIISYFNFVNRIVLGLGVVLESDGGTGYQYD